MHLSQRRLCSAVLGLSLLANQGRAEDAAPAGIVPLMQAVESKTVDLRPKFEKWELKRRSQGDRPTCSVFTFAGALEFAVASQQQQGERLSVEFLNWAANQTRRNVRDGGFFSELWDGYANHGICTEKEMPYQSGFNATNAPSSGAQAGAKTKLALGLQSHWIKQWNVNTGLTEGEFAKIKRTLAAGWPVCGGLRWPRQEDWKDEVLQMCPPEEVFDGHSVLLVGYRDDADLPGGGVFIFRNTNRGGRDGYMPYAYAQTYMNDALWIESKVKPTSASAEPRQPRQ